MVEGKIKIDMDKTVTIYRKADSWRGVTAEGVSVRYGYSCSLGKSRDKAIRRRVDQGEHAEKNVLIIIPACSLDISCKICPGDIIIAGRGKEQLSSPSQPKTEGIDYWVISETEERRGDMILPHLKILGV